MASIYSKRDLEKLFNLQTMRTSLKNIMVDRKIAGRYYQEGAIKAVCESFDKKNRRKALLVMATGSGKTRTVIALTKVLTGLDEAHAPARRSYEKAGFDRGLQSVKYYKKI